MQLFLTMLCRMENSVNPDQTAPEGAVLSRCTLFAYETMVFQILGDLSYYMLMN